jgi:hypothetical protein
MGDVIILYGRWIHIFYHWAMYMIEVQFGLLSFQLIEGLPTTFHILPPFLS